MPSEHAGKDAGAAPHTAAPVTKRNRGKLRRGAYVPVYQTASASSPPPGKWEKACGGR